MEPHQDRNIDVTEKVWVSSGLRETFGGKVRTKTMVWSEIAK